jgi:hypothetical protein
MVTRQTSRLELNPISPFAVVALVATTLDVKAEWQGPSLQQSGRRSIVASFATAAGLDHDPIRLNRIMISSFCWSMIFSENRYPLFRIML